MAVRRKLKSVKKGNLKYRQPVKRNSAATSSRPAEERFTRDLLVRGEAAERDASGELPLDATHEIAGRDESGAPIIERRRFKIA